MISADSRSKLEDYKVVHIVLFFSEKHSLRDSLQLSKKKISMTFHVDFRLRNTGKILSNKEQRDYRRGPANDHPSVRRIRTQT